MLVKKYVSYFLYPVIVFYLFLSLTIPATPRIEATISFSVPNHKPAERYVIPSGQTVGMRMKLGGILVVGIDSENSLKVGDVIKTAGGKEINNIKDFENIVNEIKNGELELEFERSGNTQKANVTPKFDANTLSYKVGLWVKDYISGVGTITFVDPETNDYQALGHAICDENSKAIISPESGEVLKCGIAEIEKGKVGSPGKIQGILPAKTEVIGDIKTNTDDGVTGHIQLPNYNKKMKIGMSNEIKKGYATILCDLDSNDEPESYEVEIEKTPSMFSKTMTIKVTDEKLIEITGGIVQGMSGSPLIQNDMLVGSVTHVFIGNPLKGYAKLIE